MYKVKQKQFFEMKGIPNQFQSNKDEPEIFINDDGSMIIIKSSQQDHLWIWSMSKESLNSEEELFQPLPRESLKDSQKKSLFRSNSYDKRNTSNNDDINQN